MTIDETESPADVLSASSWAREVHVPGIGSTVAITAAHMRTALSELRLSRPLRSLAELAEW